MMRSLRWLGASLLLLFLVVASTGLALAQTSVTVQLEPIGGSNVSGTATLTAEGNGTRVSLDIAGLAPSTTAQATMHAGTCAAPGASAAELPDLTADANGRATANGQILFRGTESVALATMADGQHIIAVGDPNGTLACGVIASREGSSADAGLPAAGIATMWPAVGLLLGAALLAIIGGLWIQTWRSRVMRQ